ncbi:Cell division cycle 5-like protein [Hordeum vulgare]|nr:Cell division cycle 5-like protein [Hordeum vulgare]
MTSFAESLHWLPWICQSTAVGESPPKMDLSLCETFLLKDPSSSDDSDVERMLLTFHQQSLVMALTVKEHKDENRKRCVDRMSVVFAFLEIAISATRC